MDDKQAETVKVSSLPSAAYSNVTW